VQAHTRHDRYIYYEADEGLVVGQYIPSDATWEYEGVPVRVRQDFHYDVGTRRGPRHTKGPDHRPERWTVDFEVVSEKPVEFSLSLRMPWWLAGEAKLTVNGEEHPLESTPSRFVELKRTWSDDQVRLILPKSLTACPLPDEPDTVAFLDGAVVLAGLGREERALYGDKRDPRSLMAPDNEREWRTWLGGYRTVNQDVGVRFVPLNEITDETYTVYFPVRARR
jgi:DUF1680 family protein